MKTFVIAEIGVNHNGSLLIAKKLIRLAKKAGVQAVKFQSYISKNLVTKHNPLTEYQKKNNSMDTMLSMLKKYEITKKTQSILYKYCKQLKIQFISSAFDIESLKYLTQNLKVNILKVPSGEITNLPYIIEVAKAKKKTILSTGMSNLFEIQRTIKVLNKNGLSSKKIILLHCNTAYPTPMKDVNLKNINYLKKYFKTDVGYSDHTLGIEVAIAAVAMGASVIEKHVTLDRALKGPDHSSSILPSELKRMVLAIRNIEQAIGKKNKAVTTSEKKNIKLVRKSIVAKKNIKKGEKFNLSNITTKRPGSGLSPFLWHKVLQLKAKKNYKEDDFIKL